MSLTLTNPNTNQTIEVPIDNQQDTIPARAFEAIRLAPTTAAAASSSDSVPLRLYDPGFKNTTVCKTSISLVDGQQGKLFYRGYDVEELVEKSNFLEVAYLLIYGELPTRKEFDQWNYNVLHHTYIHTELERQMLTFRYDAHPMGMLISTIASLSTFHPEANPALQGEGLYALPKPSSRDQDGETGAAAAATQEQQNSWDNRNRHIFRMLGKVATIAANTYRHRIGRPYNHPMPNCNQYCENMLYMMDKLNEPNYVPNDKMVEILDKLFIVLAGITI